eukprot:742867-Amphidinium_carterae.2
MANVVLAFADNENSWDECGKIPLKDRHVVSVRPREQEDLLADVTWSLKYNEHWLPEKNPVFLTIEEPLSGENVSRAVRRDGLAAIWQEVHRALDFLTMEEDLGSSYDVLVALPPCARDRAQPVGMKRKLPTILPEAQSSWKERRLLNGHGH